MGSLFSFSKCHYLFSRKLNLYRHMIYPVFFIRKFHIISVTSGQDGIISAWNLHSDILKRHISFFSMIHFFASAAKVVIRELPFSGFFINA